MTPAVVNNLLDSKNPRDPQYAVEVADELLAASAAAGASDLHLLPTEKGLHLAWRIDGVLHTLGMIPQEVAANVVARMKVLAGLLTYQTKMPQEGRVRTGAGAIEVRISTFPTLFGEKVVARNLPGDRQHLARLAELGLSAEVLQSLRQSLRQTSGALLLVGPAGSGKTTTAYAGLREIIESTDHERSIASLEDPVEIVVAGVAQSQVDAAHGFDLVTGLRSLVRQDPEVIFVGEIRDVEAAHVAFQAALTGQLLISTFHASDTAAALSRLADMKVPPFVLRSATNCVVAQRLLRKLCECAVPASANEVGALLGVEISAAQCPRGCDRCSGTGYAGRVAVAEVMDLSDTEVSRALISGVDADTLRKLAVASGMITVVDGARRLVEQGVTSAQELVRVFGLLPS